MKPGIFITPWVDLTEEEIDRCIQAGADSARIHCGKASLDKIVGLINYYHSRAFKFDLDLRGNKANTDVVDDGLGKVRINLGDRVVFYDSFLPRPTDTGAEHFVGLSFIPEAIKLVGEGDLTVDDGRLVFLLKNINLEEGGVRYVETVVSRNEQEFIYRGDGVSSTSVFIHSSAPKVLMPPDIKVLTSIPSEQRRKIRYIAVSFCENAGHIFESEQSIGAIGYNDFQVIPKVETVKGTESIDEICRCLIDRYGKGAELQVGSADLSLDCLRGTAKLNYHQLVEHIILACKKYGVKVSVLALIMQSVRHRLKKNPASEDLEPSAAELNRIKHLCDLGVNQIGLTNDMYVDRPDRMVVKLRQIINQY